MVENNDSVLYTALADRLSMAPAKSILMNIASNHHENSEILRAAGKASETARVQTGNSEKEFAGVFGIAYDIYKKIIDEKEISKEELSDIADKLSMLESALAEKYACVKSKASQSMGNAFTEMIRDSEHHRKLLTKFKTLVAAETQEETLGTDAVTINCSVAESTVPVCRAP
jgi:hypothetical protein